MDVVVENVEAAGDGLAHDAGAKVEMVALPLVLELHHAAEHVLAQAREAALDAGSRRLAGELVGNVDLHRLGHRRLLTFNLMRDMAIERLSRNVLPQIAPVSRL